MGNLGEEVSEKLRYMRLEKHDGIAIIVLDGPGKENVLDEQSSKELHAAIESVNSDRSLVGVVIISAKAESFVAGADIDMLEKADGPYFTSLSRMCHAGFDMIEKFRLPVVAAIMGTCMGAGLELMLSCCYRICVDTERTVFSLPEVRLGLLPAGGGTQRLPQQITLPSALDMLLTGRDVTAQRAYQIGLVEEIVDPILSGNDTVDYGRSLTRLEEVAVTTAYRIAMGKLNVRSWFSMWRMALNYFYSTSFVWNYFIRSSVLQKLQKSGLGNLPAPHAVLKCVETSLFSGLEEGYEMESIEFGRLAETKESKALIGLFRGITKCKKQRFGEAFNIRTAAVVGASTAGMASAWNIADEELKVNVIELNEEIRNKAVDYIEEQFKRIIAKGKILQKLAKIKKRNIIISSGSYHVLKSADIVLLTLDLDVPEEEIKIAIEKIEEAVAEQIPILVHLFGSSLADIVSSAKFPNRIIGVCYGIPYGLSKYGELVKHKQTDTATVAAAASLLCKQKLFVLLTSDSNELPGFYLVHCVLSMLSIVCDEVIRGNIKSAVEIDQFSKKAGFVGSVAEMCDMIGLRAIAKSCYRYISYRNKVELLHELVRNKRNGKASGKGFHVYICGEKVTSSADNAFKEFIKEVQINVNLPMDNWTNDRAKRLLLGVTDAALECYKNGIISSADEGDVGCVFGVGFPPALGGPFRYLTQRKNEIKEYITESQQFPNVQTHLYKVEEKFY